MLAAMDEARDVVLVRHGATEWSNLGKHTGRTDLPLTEDGRAQARAIAAPLTRWAFAAILTSPLERAAATAREGGIAAEADPALQDSDYADCEGRTTPEIRETEPGWTVWSGSIPGGESIDDVAARADRVIARVQAVDGDVALVSHGHFLRVLAARWLGLPPTAGASLILGTGTLSVLSTERDAPAIRLWNGLPR